MSAAISNKFGSKQEICSLAHKGQWRVSHFKILLMMSLLKWNTFIQLILEVTEEENILWLLEMVKVRGMMWSVSLLIGCLRTYLDLPSFKGAGRSAHSAGIFRIRFCLWMLPFELCPFFFSFPSPWWVGCVSGVFQLLWGGIGRVGRALGWLVVCY